MLESQEQQLQSEMEKRGKSRNKRASKEKGGMSMPVPMCIEHGQFKLRCPKCHPISEEGFEDWWNNNCGLQRANSLVYGSRKEMARLAWLRKDVFEREQAKKEG